MSISPATRRDVRTRARDRCEYCGLAQTSFPLVTFHVEHVVSRQHGGGDQIDNLCLSCHWCNLFKGPNLSTLVDDKLVRLFNPRTDDWDEHFSMVNGIVRGLSSIAVATARLLNMNDADRVELRRLGEDKTPR